jgi:hypothetical protein
MSDVPTPYRGVYAVALQGKRSLYVIAQKSSGAWSRKSSAGTSGPSTNGRLGLGLSMPLTVS